MSKWKIAGIAVVFGVVIFGIIKMATSGNGSGARTYGQYERSILVDLARGIDFSKYDPDTMMEANEDMGGIGEKIRGEKDAPLTIYEYADYTCSHCANWQVKIEELLEKYPGKFKVVFRDFVLGYTNSVSSASAANAAFLQGYWEEFASLLFANQNEWYSLSGRALYNKFEEYLEVASEGKADTKKFYADMKSEEVAKRLAFNIGFGSMIDLQGTPTFRIDGKKIELADMLTTIEQRFQK